MPCPICGDSSGKRWQATERMFGLGGDFQYEQCAGCGCLRLINPPADMSPYYPPQYYSLAKASGGRPAPQAGLRRWLYERRNAAQYFARPNIWRLLAHLRPAPCVPHDIRWQAAGVGRLDARILDVGCGSGDLLRRLSQAGFSRLTGVDPYLTADERYGDGLRLLACPLDALAGQQFDLVMFHHVLEHLADQAGQLRLAAGMLAPGGACLVRLPLAWGEPWREYGADWVELDAPRHHYLHTPRSLCLVAEQAGLDVVETVYDSEGFSYWASECYRRGLTLYDADAAQMRNPQTIFSADELKHFDRRAKAANAAGEAGRAAFYFRRRQRQGSAA